MFPDNTLTPKEATRLCALGILAEAPRSYSALATEIRAFVSRVSGPSLDLMGSSIELLKYEGLVEPVSGSGLEDDAVLAITAKGREELRLLLTAGLRSGASELTKLLVTLKFRFLHLLDRDDRLEQVDLLEETWEANLAALEDLRRRHAETPGHLTDWLGHSIDGLRSRLDWLKDFRARL